MHSKVSPFVRPANIVATILFCGVSALLLFVSSARAQTIISVNFSGTNASSLASGDSTGVVSAANWNNLGGVSGTSAILNNSAGGATGITVSYIATGLGGTQNFEPNGSPQSLLIGSGLGVNFGTASFTLSGLDAFSSYEIVVYYSGRGSFPEVRSLSLSSSEVPTIFYGAGYNSQFTNFKQATSTDSAAPTTGNYIIFSGLTDATQTITAGQNSNQTTLSGFQIIGTPVPEPGTVMLITLGGMMVLLLRRKADKVIH